MIYDTVEAVLSELNAQGEEDHDDWYEQVAQRLGSLEASYGDLRNANRDLIDYSDLATQAAYVFRYVLGHAEFIYDFLTDVREQLGTPLFTKEELWVTSLGGGPGSKLLGLIKYLSEEENEPSVSKIVYTIIDKEKNWEHVVEAFVAEIGTDTDIEIKLYFQECDVSASSIPNAVTLKDEELLIMSFFISEICALPNSGRVRQNIQQLLATMPVGAWLLYKDSNAYSFYKFLNAVVQAVTGFNQLVEVEATFKLDTPIYTDTIRGYIDQFDYRPKLSSNAVSKMLRRVKP